MAELLDEILMGRGIPKSIRPDNGLELISKDGYLRAYWNQVQLDISLPSKSN